MSQLSDFLDKVHKIAKINLEKDLTLESVWKRFNTMADIILRLSENGTELKDITATFEGRKIEDFEVQS